MSSLLRGRGLGTVACTPLAQDDAVEVVVSDVVREGTTGMGQG